MNGDTPQEESAPDYVLGTAQNAAAARTGSLTTESDVVSSINHHHLNRERKASIDNIISSIAGDTSNFTNDRILTRNLVDRGAHQGQAIDESSHQSHNVDEPSNQPDLVLDNDEDFLPPPQESIPVHQGSVSNEVYQVSYDSPTEPYATQHEYVEHSTLDPPTLIEGSRRASELQEYVPEQHNEGSSDFVPTQYQLLPEDIVAKDGPLPLLHDPLPWDQQPNDENLPWETQQNEHLPWEKPQDDELQWDYDFEKANAKAAINTIPEASHEGSTEDFLVEPQQSLQAHQPQSETNEYVNLPLGSHQTHEVAQPQTTDQTQEVDHNQENTPELPENQPETLAEYQPETLVEHQPEPQHEGFNSPQIDNVEPLAEPELQPEFIQPLSTLIQQDLPWEASNDVDMDARVVEQPEPQVPSQTNLDALFAQDDDDFLSKLDPVETAPVEHAPLVSEPSIEATDGTNEITKSLLDLDLDLDDDLLLDDEFLNETSHAEPASVEQPKQTYAPSKKHNIYASQNAVQAPVQVPKKIGDYGDFPDDLITTKIRPATRHPSSKYSGASTSSLPPKSNSYAPSPSADHHPGNSAASSPAVQPKPIQHKPSAFFGELPIKPKEGHKPARAATVKALNQSVPQAPPVLEPNTSKPPPPNPYMPSKQPPAATTGGYNAPLPQAGTSSYGSQKPPQQSAYAPPQGNSYAPPPPANSYAPSPPANSYAPPPQANNYAPPPQASSYAPQPQQNNYAPPPQQNNLAPPPQGNNFVPQPPTNNYAPPPQGNNVGSLPPQVNNYAPSQGNQVIPPPQQLPLPSAPVQLQAFPTVQSQGHNPSKLPSTSPIITNVARTQGSNSATSPYVPSAGPYAPNQHQRTHSRASSLVGVKGKEMNPYAPALPTVPNTQQTAGVTPGVAPSTNPNRVRGFSNTKPNIYSKAQPAPKVSNPQALLQRQFPIFNWSTSSNIVCLVPNIATHSYDTSIGSINIKPAYDVLNEKDLIANFPGPLSKLKTKKKDVEKWLEDNVASLHLSPVGQDELVLSQVLLALLKADGNVKLPEFVKEVCSVLNPTVDYYSNAVPESSGALNVANAYKLDNSGINTVFSLIQTGNIDKALDFTIGRSDWALSLVIASFSGPEKFAKIASDFARNSFPFQKSNNKVHHIMPTLLKIFAGNVLGVIDDFSSVATEGEYANIHWREIVASVVVSRSLKAPEFLIEFGKFLQNRGNVPASEICFILAGLPLSHMTTVSGVVFSYVTSSLYTETYEYVSSLAPSSTIPPNGLAHLLTLKLKHASILADYGLFNESQRYLDSIGSLIKVLGNRSPFVNPVLIHEFQNLIVRLSESSSTELGWFSGKMSKVNLDKVWGQLDKFIGGDEPKPKSSKTGVFSKFSPSVSRTTSTLDFTAMNSSYNQRGDSENTLILGATAQLREARNPSFAGATSAPLPPALVSYNSTNTVSKYAPPSLQNQVKHSQVGSPIHNGRQLDSASRYAPSNASSQNLGVNEYGEPPSAHKRPSIKQSPSVPRGIQPPSFTLNPMGQVSSSSINSQVQHAPAGEVIPQTYNRKASVASIMSTESYTPPEAFRTHNRSPSMQSDISMDYPLEFKPTTRRPHDLRSSPLPDSPEKKREEIYRETINESPELESLQSNQVKPIDDVPVPEPPVSESVSESASALAPPSAYEPPVSELNGGEADVSTPPPPPPPSGQKVPNKSNPYAPKSSSSKTQRLSKYGPPGGKTTSRYTVPSAGSVPVEDNSPLSGSADMFSYGGYSQAPPTGSSLEPLNTAEEKEQVDDVPVKKAPEPAPVQNYSNASKYAPPASNYNATKMVPNIDDSFDNDHSLEEEVCDIQTPKPSKLFLNSGSPNTGNNLANPYQGGANALDSNFGFPIPGSPDYTTRANSVVGGPTGLFSSRLSQSHQSALYQQYEVNDDTVRDYVPVVEEEEEDEDEEDVKAKQEAAKKEEQEKKAREEAAKARVRADAAAAKRDPNQGKWFAWLGPKDDGKPKATRANLGEKNVFYFDETHKRWLDSTKPIDEQLAAAAPPPPPSMKKKPVPLGGPSRPSGAAPGAPPSAGGPPSGAPTASASGAPTPLGSASNDGPTAPSGPAGRAPQKAKPSLATAGLDELLSLGGSAPGGGNARKAKRGARRGYVNVMDQN